MHREALPFYLTYPGDYKLPKGVITGLGWNLPSENVLLQDLEYFETIYPGKVKHYQQRIAEILDRLDYENSFIYDEYPDRFSMERMVENMVEVLSREAEKEEKADFDRQKEAPLIFVLCGMEIYKKRHGAHRSFWM